MRCNSVFELITLSEYNTKHKSLFLCNMRSQTTIKNTHTIVETMTKLMDNKGILPSFETKCQENDNRAV